MNQSRISGSDKESTFLVWLSCTYPPLLIFCRSRNGSTNCIFSLCGHTFSQYSSRTFLCSNAFSLTKQKRKINQFLIQCQRFTPTDVIYFIKNGYIEARGKIQISKQLERYIFGKKSIFPCQ